MSYQISGNPLVGRTNAIMAGQVNANPAVTDKNGKPRPFTRKELKDIAAYIESLPGDLVLKKQAPARGCKASRFRGSGGCCAGAAVAAAPSSGFSCRCRSPGGAASTALARVSSTVTESFQPMQASVTRLAVGQVLHRGALHVILAAGHRCDSTITPTMRWSPLADLAADVLADRDLVLVLLAAVGVARHRSSAARPGRAFEMASQASCTLAAS